MVGIWTFYVVCCIAHGLGRVGAERAHPDASNRPDQPVEASALSAQDLLSPTPPNLFVTSKSTSNEEAMEDQRGTSAVTASPENKSGPDGRAEGSSLPAGSKGPGGKDAEETQGIPVPSHRIQVTAQVYMDPEAYLQVSGHHAQATRAAVPEPATETGERYERRVSQDTKTWQHALTLLTGEYGAAIVIGLACTVRPRLMSSIWNIRI